MKENGPRVLTSSSNALTPATRCSKPSRRKLRVAESATLERASAAEAGVGLMPEADLVLPLLPAEVDLAAVAQRRKVHQATLQVAQHDLALAQLHHGLAQRQEAFRDRASDIAPAVARRRLGERLARLAVAQPRAGRAQRLDELLHPGQRGVRLLERVVAAVAGLVAHAAVRERAFAASARLGRVRAEPASRMRLSSSFASASETVRSWPWKASCQCSAGHFRACSSSAPMLSAGTNSSSSRISSGSVSKRHGYSSGLPGFPGHTLVRSS